MTPAGPVHVERTLYNDRADEGIEKATNIDVAHKIIDYVTKQAAVFHENSRAQH